MKKFLKSLISVALLAIILLVAVLPAAADTYIGEKYYETGALWWKKYHIYKAYMEYRNGFVYHNDKLSRVVQHTYNSQPAYLDSTLTLTDGFSKSYNTTLSWNSSLGLSVGLSNIVGLTAEKGYGTSFGLGWSITRSSSFAKNIYNWFPTGNYFMAPGVDIYVCREEHWLRNENGVYINIQEDNTYYMPDSDTYVSLYYNTSSSSPIYPAP